MIDVSLGDLERRGLEVFGLPPEFSGFRWIACSGSGPLELGLAHGDPRTNPSGVIIVGAMLRTFPDGNGIRPALADGIDIFDTLATGLMLAENEAPVGKEGTEELELWTRDLLNRVPGRESWLATSIKVSGRPTHFHQLTVEHGWTAFCELGSTWLYVQSLDKGPSELDLVRIHDLSPYRAGSRLLDCATQPEK